MKIVIYDNAEGYQVGEYVVNVRGLNYQASEAEHFQLAYESLVEDGLSGGKRFDEFRFIAVS